MKIKELVELADKLFSTRSALMSLWQEIAENFYAERADFTYQRYLGTDYAAQLTTSYPLLCRRDLADQVSTMLRPTAKQWFYMQREDERKESNDAQRWMQWATNLQRRAMYDRVTRLDRATKELDNDYVTFGNGVMSIELNRLANALLYRTWHPRDVVWKENEIGEIGLIARKWKPTRRDLMQLFKNKNAPTVQSMANTEPYAEVECMHLIVEADMVDVPADGKPYISIYYDKTNFHEIEVLPVWNKTYIIPRWQTVSGSQYGFSAATVIALPDSRLLQAMSYTMLEAGEKLTNPPMIATVDAVRSDVNVYAGGITWVDQEYDERTGEALRPMNLEYRSLPIGREMQQDTRQQLAQAFYLNKLTLPQRTPEMTAYEVGQRIQEYIRGALPLFAPMETEYNGAMCEATFEVLKHAGAFGDPRTMPKELQGANFKFRFESPLHDAIEAAKGQVFLNGKQIIAEAVELDPGATALPDAKVILRDVLAGIGWPAKWVRSQVSVEEIEAQQKQQQQIQQTLANMQTGSEVVNNLGQANKNMQAAA